MTMKNRTSYKIRKIRSLHDLELEKARLKLESMKIEEQIKGNYRNLVGVLSIRGLIQLLTSEITLTKTAVSTAFSIGKSLIEKFRKRKKNKDKAKSTSAPSPADGIKVEE
jgi:hypothetical protein